MVERQPSSGVDEGLLRPTPRPDGVLPLDHMIAALVELDANRLCLQWRNCLGGTPPAHLPRWLLMRVLAFRAQAAALGGLDMETLRILRQPKGETLASSDGRPFETRIATTREGAKLKAGALLAREWKGRLERVTVLEKGFAWNGEPYGSLSQVAKAMTGTNWNGHRFFGLRTAKPERSATADRRQGICAVASARVASASIKDGRPVEVRGSRRKGRQEGASITLAASL
jgi:Protein of unknown function (DUF2924)